MIFNEIKCHVNTSLGLVGGASPTSPLSPRLGTACEYKSTVLSSAANRKQPNRRSA